MDIERIQELARLDGLDLLADHQGLFLTDGVMSVRTDFERMAKRLRAGSLQRELLVKAAHVKGVSSPTAIDATAGLGEDALLLAGAGFQVTLYERNPVIAALLEDGVKRALEIPGGYAAAARMKVVAGDSVEALPRLQERPDVVFLDPMFPAKRGEARAKKKLQLLQRLEQPCDDEAALLDAALAARPRKVVVKHPLKGPFLAERKPAYNLKGTTIRYDCYLGV